MALFVIHVLFLEISSARADIDLSDLPLLTRIMPPPPNIMFLLDDSTSMNFDILVGGGYNGSYPNTNPDIRGFCYLFDNLGDNVISAASYYAGAEGRKHWKTQWYPVNVMYYNPYITYAPWPSYGTTVFTDADKDTPRSHPRLYPSTKLDLQETSFTVGSLMVPHAHYFVYSAKEGKPYLVVIDRAATAIKYYEVAVTGTGWAEKVSTLTENASPPADVVSSRTYNAERQNFANWFTYFRRREYMAKNALASVLKSLSDVRVGISGINQKIIAPLQPVNLIQGTSISDHTQALLSLLYSYPSEGPSPLKQGLSMVGEFFKTNTGTIAGRIGPKPYGESGQGAACQQSVTVVFTDGYYSDPEYRWGGNADQDNGEPYADNLSDTLADIAMYYYENDLNPLANQVPASKYDDATHQHLTTFAVALGVAGSLNPAEFDESFHHRTTRQRVQWPALIGERSPQAIDDLWHATVNGHGKFYNAANPQELTTALAEFMKAVSKILSGSSSAVTVNGDGLYGTTGSNTYLYQALYSNQNEEWTGDIKRFPVDPETGEVETAGARVWSAAAKLAATPWSERLIATFSGSTGIPFQASLLTDDQKAALGANPDEKVKHLRGAAVSGFRHRSQKLGDIVNSAPVFLDDVIYAGSNDGMLHAFDATTGAEIFAYVPNLVFGHLELLTDTAYTHRFYVDLTPTVKKDAGILGGTTTRALLVGGLGKGGKGYFALDITGAKTITTETGLASRVLWEFPKTDDPDMGYSFSKPVIVKSNDFTYPWLVMFGNGYNSDSGKSMLYIVDPATGVLIRKIEADPGPDNGLSSPVAVDVTYDGKVDFVYAGDLKGQLWKFDLSSDSISEWKAAFSDGASLKPLFHARGPGGVAQPITTRPDIMYHPEKHGLLVCFGTGRFLGDEDITDTATQSIYGVWDYGDRVFNLKAKKWSPDDDREFLGEIVRSGSGRLSNQPDTVSLLKQTQKDYTVRIGAIDYRFRVLSSAKPIWLTMADPDARQQPNPSAASANHAGYYLDLNPGERVISDVMIRNGNLLAIGFTPTTDPCSAGGSSMFMELNAFTGGSVGGNLFDLTGDRKIDARDVIRLDFDGDGRAKNMNPSGIEFMGHLLMPAILRLPGENDLIEKKYLSSSSGKIETLAEKSIKLGITYWMEIRY